MSTETHTLHLSIVYGMNNNDQPRNNNYEDTPLPSRNPVSAAEWNIINIGRTVEQTILSTTLTKKGGYVTELQNRKVQNGG
jgi:hypothetical protein